ncbi:MAG TPA: ATP-binding cassette domain-containing protein [Bacteroidales bacterium]|nr:ATP-binding cassette domain-containing protein [Bacteroidales bacterium]
MSETILKALMKLFALIGDFHDDDVTSGRERDLVRTFLSRQLNNELVKRFMSLYEEYLGMYKSESIKKGTVREKKRISLNSMRILGICEQINEELEQKQKLYVLIQLLDYISLGEKITDNEIEFLDTVAMSFYVPDDEYFDIRSFVLNDLPAIKNTGSLLIIDNKEKSFEGTRHLTDNIPGQVQIMHVSFTNTYILRYYGNEDLSLNGQIMDYSRTYIFDHGSVIRGHGINAIYYTEVVSLINDTSYDKKVILSALNVSFRFRRSSNGIHNMNFNEESGQLVGILGGSGVGKSTTLSILNGTLKPQEGDILINGYNLYDEKDREELKGVIGYVPQDDLLIEELTVFQNLLFNARMCLGNLSEEELHEAVNQVLNDLDLYEIRSLRVGSPLKKVISGGQRKRLNIALELIREPTILFVDEPTSGLSSTDSELVMNLLKEQTYKGKLVIVNIHQPGSDIYKMFDRIMIIDRGGYQVFYGNPSEAIVYFKTTANLADPYEDQCSKCGNINTEQILQILEARVVDEHGKATRTRKISPEEWADRFRQYFSGKANASLREKKELPANNYSIPGLWRQSVIYFTRDFLSKLANRQYMVITMLGPPLLALLLSWFTRSSSGDTYIFRDNDNIPVYLFMCVITSLFFGLIISSEEIVKDRKILKRESFLNLSWFSYLNSKVIMMFLISAVQAILFTLVGNYILEIKGMTAIYWFVLFSTSCFANMLGLNISSAFNSVITIYILIPFIIIPQLLFSGVMVKFDKLHLPDGASREYTPVIGDLMAARWSYEALAVAQFRGNRYERNFFHSEMEETMPAYYASFLIDKLEKDLNASFVYLDSVSYRNDVNSKLGRLDTYITRLSDEAGIVPGGWKDNLTLTGLDDITRREARAYLDSLKHIFMRSRNTVMAAKSYISDSLERAIGKQAVVTMRDNYENKALTDFVLYRDNIHKIDDLNGRIIPMYNPGLMKATSPYGRAHFYAPVKKLGNIEIDTYTFNMIVIWILSALLYTALYFMILKKLLGFSGSLRMPKSD